MNDTRELRREDRLHQLEVQCAKHQVVVATPASGRLELRTVDSDEKHWMLVQGFRCSGDSPARGEALASVSSSPRQLTC